MRYPLGLIAVLALTSPVAAQTPAQTFTLTVTSQDLSVIGTALADRPYKDVAPILNNLNQQVNAQLPKPDKDADKKPDDAKQ